MNVIILPNDRVMRELKPLFQSAHKSYRFMKFCSMLSVDGGKLIYNYLVRSLVWIRDSEFETILEEWDSNYDYIQFLMRNYFIVPENYNEFEVVNTLRKKFQPIIDDNWLDHPDGFTILTTTTCNARCFYCYENPIENKKPMSRDTAKDIIKYITRVAPSLNIKLRWFGGEPLFNVNIINLISERLLSLGYKISSSIITNGYLFDEEMCNRAKYIWNINSVQITLDGTEEVYNRVKRYIYKDDPNPFAKVINNIKTLLSLEIPVSIRMNCDKHNAENLKELVQYLSDTFKEREPLFNIYVYPLFELNGFSRTPEYRKEVFDKIAEIEELIVDNGFDIGKNVNSDIKALHCMVDSGTDVLISTDGDLGLCEHYITEDFWGHINNPELKNWDVINSWREYSEPLEVCKKCPIYPVCLKSKKCPDCNICDENWLELELRHAQFAVLRYYKLWKEGKLTQGNTCQIQQSCNSYQGDKCEGHMVLVFSNEQCNVLKDNDSKKDEKWFNKLSKWLWF